MFLGNISPFTGITRKPSLPSSMEGGKRSPTDRNAGGQMNTANSGDHGDETNPNLPHIAVDSDLTLSSGSTVASYATKPVGYPQNFPDTNAGSLESSKESWRSIKIIYFSLNNIIC